MLNVSQGGQYDESFTLPGSESQRAADAIQDRFPGETVYSSNVVFHTENGLSDPEIRVAIEQSIQRLAVVPHVIAVTSPYQARGPTLSDDDRTAFATVGFDTQQVGVAELDAADNAVQPLREAGIQVEYDGGLRRLRAVRQRGRRARPSGRS